MQFKVPQFLDIEDKIFGPLTFSEFVYLAGGGGIAYVLFQWLGFLLGAIPIIFVIGLALALTFYKPNGKPFVHMLESAFKYALGDKLFVWKKKKKKKQPEKVVINKEEEQKKFQATHREKISGERLRDLAWSLDVLDLKKGDNS